MEDGLAALQGQYDDALKKKADLEASVDNTNKKLERATTVRDTPWRAAWARGHTCALRGLWGLRGAQVEKTCLG